MLPSLMCLLLTHRSFSIQDLHMRLQRVLPDNTVTFVVFIPSQNICVLPLYGRQKAVPPQSPPPGPESRTSNKHIKNSYFLVHHCDG